MPQQTVLSTIRANNKIVENCVEKSRWEHKRPGVFRGPSRGRWAGWRGVMGKYAATILLRQKAARVSDGHETGFSGGHNSGKGQYFFGMGLL